MLSSEGIELPSRVNPQKSSVHLASAWERIRALAP